jgi:hypothetical protein
MGATNEQFLGLKNEINSQFERLAESQSRLYDRMARCEDNLDSKFREHEKRVYMIIAALERFHIKVEQSAINKRNFSEKPAVFSTEARVVPVARNKVSVRKRFVMLMFLHLQRPKHKSEPDTFDRYLKHQGVSSFSPSIVQPSIAHALIPSGQITSPTALSKKKLKVTADFSATECSSAYSDSQPTSEDDPIPEVDFCIGCCSYDYWGDRLLHPLAPLLQ